MYLHDIYIMLKPKSIIKTICSYDACPGLSNNMDGKKLYWFPFVMKFKPKVHSLAPNKKEGIGTLKWDYNEFLSCHNLMLNYHFNVIYASINTTHCRL